MSEYAVGSEEAFSLDQRGDLSAHEVALLGEKEALQRLDLLASASRILDSTLDDYEQAVLQVVDACVPDFADMCAVEVISANGEITCAGYRAVHTSGLRLPEEWIPIGRSIAPDRRAVLAHERNFDETEQVRQIRERFGAQSLVVCPIAGGGITLGWFVAASGSYRRGFRPSALRIGVELASRLGAAIQRVLLHREMQASAREQSRAVRRLRRLATAATNLAGAATTAEVLRVACVEACVIQEADGAIAQWWMADGTQVTAHTGEIDFDRAEAAFSAVANHRPARGRGWVAHPLPSSDPWQHAALVVFVEADLSADEELVLSSLASLVPVAFERALGTEAVVLHEARLRAVIEASPVALVGVQPDGVVTLANRAAGELFGWVAEPDDLGAVDPVQPAIMDLVGEVCATGAVVNKSVTLGDLELSVSGAPMPAVGPGADEQTTVLVAGVDLTEVHRAERALVQAQRLEAMGVVAGRVAHDFNNLLTLIIGYTELLRRGLIDDGQVRLVTDIEGAVKRASGLTQQMLGMTRRLDTDAVIDISAELTGMDTVLTKLVGPRIHLTLSALRGPARVRMAGSEIEQIVINLVVNASDAMEGSGSISVAADLELRAVPGVVLTVADDGPGMPEDVLARCLEPFFTTKRRGAGSGLGLSTVYGLVKERGGDMHIDSKPGAGTSFQIWLPLCDAPVLAEPQDDQPLEVWPAGRRISGRILFVEDDDDLRQMGHRTLITTGVEIVLAPSAEDALTTLALQGPFDAMVTDIMLPGLSGVELATATRESHPHMPVMFMTGYTGTLPADVQPPADAPLLRKPYKPDALRLRVADLVDQAALQGSKR